VPEHEHAGAEWIMVLTGSQADERGEYAAGTLVINPPGSRHRVWTGGGCIVLAIWQRPVVFV
jgi:anti-sigma factor ChrR (cupin superfamily)